jgi:C4-dicarboxylate-specific signal transduction histidine kinase
MKLMAWSDHFVTGISAVDAQHHALVDMVKAVAPSLSLGDAEGAPNAVYNDALIDLFGLLSERNRTVTQTNQQLLAAKAELQTVNRSLESRVQVRTHWLSLANTALLAEQHALEASLAPLERSQSQLLQSEIMAAVGQLAAGVAHEINNLIGRADRRRKSAATPLALLAAPATPRACGDI